MATASQYPRYIRPRIEEALADTPVVLIHGPRQCGKTTLARTIGDDAGYAYITFDDEIRLTAATEDPVGFVAELPDKVVLDEVQRAPQLFMSIKATVDRQRKPGRFLLTGSANVLVVPKLADSLAGRMGILRLHPLAQCELISHRPGFLNALFAGKFTFKPGGRLGKNLAQRIMSGGYPDALHRGSSERRAEWYRDYIETLVQRDISDLARISALDALPRLLELAAGQTARLVNVSELAGPFNLNRKTIRDYVALLERVFLLELLPPWHTNRLSRLIKKPKLHLGDTGLCAALLNFDADGLMQDRDFFGQLLETFVFQELRRQASWHEKHIAFYHFRDKDGAEVDIVIELGARGVAGVEVKASSTVTGSDFRGLRKLQEATGKRFLAGIVLYDGDSVARFGEGLYAVPINALWEA